MDDVSFYEELNASIPIAIYLTYLQVPTNIEVTS